MAIIKKYNILNLSGMPTGVYSSNCIINKNIDWAITRKFKDFAKNHCGAVLVTNLAIYFSSSGYKNLIVDDSVSNTFNFVHKIVGNGPVIKLSSKARTYFAERGCDLHYKRVNSYEKIKEAVNRGNPLGLLLSNGFTNWHWVMVVGWREYETGDNYLNIVDGWNNSINRFYKINSRSIWWMATEYWIGKS
ncbi:hypothetical protein [Alkalibacter mobilis]|uniref:hypothetical protein n=1 Tax=Alkalibacter mobilis TaxID=2787712 RepID=UPI00189ED5B0|nr:hypothetical protein [Alkalibacter mobilis]MBF7097556.1 hypothetical protein [Alkalibacter mobilis]